MSSFAPLNRLLADLDAQRQLVPAREEHLRQQEQLDWSYHAETLRGNTLTLPEARELLLHGLTAAGKPLRDHLALEAHQAAVQQLAAWLHSGQPLTESHLRGLHAALLGLPTGTESPYKTTSNNLLTADGLTRYFSAPEDTPARVADLLAWYRRETAHPTLHPVELAAQLHHRFGRIRPFAAGNGSLARLLLNAEMLRYGYPVAFIKADEYANYRTASAAATGEPEAFLHFLTERVAAALRRHLRALRGESVDETGELQAKLAQLKQLVLGQEDTVTKLWDEESQATIYNTLVGPWVTDVIKQTRDFDDLFMSRDYSGGIDMSQGPAVRLEPEGDVEAFAGFFRAAVSGAHAEVAAIHFSKRWLHFRQRNNGFDTLLRVSFSFRPDHFIVRQALASSHGPAEALTHWEGDVFTSTYLPAYDHSRLHEINHALALKLYDFLTSRLPGPSLT